MEAMWNQKSFWNDIKIKAKELECMWELEGTTATWRIPILYRRLIEVHRG